MEDRYLFKVKRVDDGEWVRGNLIYTFTGTPYIVAEYDHIINFISIDEVDPTTICQCTGLNDKNGKLIWENDIVKDENGNLYKAFWQNNYYQFSWICINSDKLPIGAKWNLWNIKSFEIEVIGNIFDNPELLESEE